MAPVDSGMEFRAPMAPKLVAVAAALAGAAVATVIVLLMALSPETLPGVAARKADAAVLSLFAAAALFMGLGGLVAMSRPGMGGAVAFTGVLFWTAGVLAFKNYGWVLVLPVILAGVGGLTGMIASDHHAARRDRGLVYRQDAVTRVTHWIWAIALFFLLQSGLQIFNARPNLYIGHESGFAYQNSVLDIYAVRAEDGSLRGQTRLFGQVYDTTGVLGVSGPETRQVPIAFPGWATIPSTRDLATGRVVHFFFAWVLAGTLAIWLINAIFSGHLWRDIVMKPRDLRELPGDVWRHLRLKFEHGRRYTPLQKLAYFAVFAVAFPVIILTGLAMSPGMNAAWPWLVDVFGGRQTARTIHFIAMVAFVLFFFVHVAMVLLAGPINELRSMVTGYYRTRGERAEE